LQEAQVFSFDQILPQNSAVAIHSELCKPQLASLLAGHDGNLILVDDGGNMVSSLVGNGGLVQLCIDDLLNMLEIKRINSKIKNINELYTVSVRAFCIDS
jgi:hypothetical protein